jgi:hypothetical protein
MNRTSVVLSIEGVVGTMAWNGNNFTFSPASALAHLGSYTVSVSGRDLAGNSGNPFPFLIFANQR